MDTKIANHDFRIDLAAGQAGVRRVWSDAVLDVNLEKLYNWVSPDGADCMRFSVLTGNENKTKMVLARALHHEYDCGTFILACFRPLQERRGGQSIASLFYYSR